MNSERFWVLVLAATTFFAGLAAGLLLSYRLHPAQQERPFGAYEAQMVAAFDLDEERARNLRWILDAYREKIEGLKERNIAALDSELVKIGHDSRELIKTYVIPDHHLRQFNQWVDGQPVLSGAKLQ